jgi:hypothetical protein
MISSIIELGTQQIDRIALQLPNWLIEVGRQALELPPLCSVS